MLTNVLPLRSSAAPPLTVIPLEDPPKAVVLPACRVPPDTEVPPVYVLVPAKLRIPAAPLDPVYPVAVL